MTQSSSKKADQLRYDALEVDRKKKLANYRWVKRMTFALVLIGTLYMMDLNTYVISIPAGLFVFLWNGASTTFFSGGSLFLIDEASAYVRFGLVGLFYLAGFIAWNSNRMNKP